MNITFSLVEFARRRFVAGLFFLQKVRIFGKISPLLLKKSVSRLLKIVYEEKYNKYAVGGLYLCKC